MQTYFYLILFNTFSANKREKERKKKKARKKERKKRAFLAEEVHFAFKLILCVFLLHVIYKQTNNIKICSYDIGKSLERDACSRQP